MARPRTFDEHTVIQEAMYAFWKTGYETTSIGMLEAATGISRISLYNAFGDKSQLFLTALETYGADTRNFFANEAFLSGGPDAISALLESAARPRGKDGMQNYGCLMMNTILDVEAAGPKAREIVSGTRMAMIKGFETNMRRAIRSGVMASVSQKTLKDRAEFLVGALWGGRMTARLSHDVRAAKGVMRTAIAVVESWK